MHDLSTNQATKAVAGEIKKARVAIETAEKAIDQVFKSTEDFKKQGRSLSQDEKQRLLAEIDRAKNGINAALENVQNATPNDVPESATKLIDETMSNLRLALANLDRRTVKLSEGVS